jgi:hypothetical protein
MYIQFRLLETKQAEQISVANLWAPSFLQSDKGSKFANRVVEEVCSVWN